MTGDAARESEESEAISKDVIIKSFTNWWKRLVAKWKEHSGRNRERNVSRFPQPNC